MSSKTKPSSPDLNRAVTQMQTLQTLNKSTKNLNQSSAASFFKTNALMRATPDLVSTVPSVYDDAGPMLRVPSQLIKNLQANAEINQRRPSATPLGNENDRNILLKDQGHMSRFSLCHSP